jgi:hypothetical protein
LAFPGRLARTGITSCIVIAIQLCQMAMKLMEISRWNQ